jgi:hypothetical protein
MKWVVLASVVATALAFGGTAAADRPVEQPLHEVFVDVNPCTGLEHTVTVVGTFFRHDHGGQNLYRLERTVTTSSGFSGRGVEVGVQHDRIVVVDDVLTNDVTGERIKAHLVLVEDAAGAVRVFRFELRCLGSP